MGFIYLFCTIGPLKSLLIGNIVNQVSLLLPFFDGVAFSLVLNELNKERFLFLSVVRPAACHRGRQLQTRDQLSAQMPEACQPCAAEPRPRPLQAPLAARTKARAEPEMRNQERAGGFLIVCLWGKWAELQRHKSRIIAPLPDPSGVSRVPSKETSGPRKEFIERHALPLFSMTLTVAQPKKETLFSLP